MIEVATVHDLQAMLIIENESHISPWSDSMLKDSLSGRHLCWKLSVDNKILAYLIVMKTLDEIEILNIVVAPPEQGQGLGQYLLEYLIIFSSKNHIKSIFLEVRKSNAAALDLYLKAGFKQVGIRKNYYACRDGREDALVMQLACHAVVD